jgi:hypothetical protein
MPNRDNRSEGRSNVFLAVSLKAGERIIPVRVRNIASKGMLVEGIELPPIGTRVTLVRGHLSVAGQLAWGDAGQGGINLDEPINVGTWIERVGHLGQQRVDHIVAAIRTRTDIPSDEGPSPLATLEQISGALDSVCQKLASMPKMSTKFSELLLILDTVAQALRDKASGKA